jgi:DNA-directed RNA polymerase subunit RPC12/RpoP
MKAKNLNTHLTSKNDVTDINPQCFSREMVIGNHWDQTSVMSGSPKGTPKMTEKYNCQTCQKQIPPNGHYITRDHYVLCFECTDTPALHSHLWPECEDTWHDPWDHIRYLLASRAATAHILSEGTP